MPTWYDYQNRRQRSWVSPPINRRFISYAKNFEDVMLHRALADVDKGFYIDVGRKTLSWSPSPRPSTSWVGGE